MASELLQGDATLSDYFGSYHHVCWWVLVASNEQAREPLRVSCRSQGHASTGQVVRTWQVVLSLEPQGADLLAQMLRIPGRRQIHKQKDTVSAAGGAQPWSRRARTCWRRCCAW